MALTAGAAAAQAGQQIAAVLAAPLPPGDTRALNTLLWTQIAEVIFNAITQFAEVDPAGSTPMTVNVSGTPTPVVGTGKIT